MRVSCLAAGLVAGAAVLSPPIAAQPPAAPDSVRAPRADPSRTAEREVVREFRIRRRGPAGVGLDEFLVGPGAPGDVRIFVDDAADRRSVVGIVPGAADSLGLRVERVAPDGPAARAGIAAGDRLAAVNGTSLRVDRADAGDPLLAAVPARRLTRAVGRLAPGSDVELRVVRDGRERSVRVRTAAPGAVAAASGAPGDGPAVREFRQFRRFGPDGPDRIEFFGGPGADPASADRIRRLRGRADSVRTAAAARPVLGMTLGGTGSARDTLGLFVQAVAAGGPAERAGVVEGDRVAALNDVDLRVPRDERDEPEAAAARRARFTRELSRLRPGDRVTLRLWGDGRARTVTATVGRAGDVYRGAGAFGAAFGPGFGERFGPGVGPDIGPGFGPAFGERFGPMLAPEAAGPPPGVRRLRVPLPPRAPRPPLAARRTVTI
jgi:membrane-associated protease RseP (regulator of RpoE activity)